jgi:NAD(P)-dependent dehydrogenase (short-subunit alcohol dehydrogenase family)
MKGQGLPVFAVNAGFVPTPLVMRLVDDPEARRWLPRFTEAMAEGKEVGPEVAAEMVAWLADERPMALSGRVIPAVQTPEILLTRLGRIAAEDLHRLRLK